MTAGHIHDSDSRIPSTTANERNASNDKANDPTASAAVSAKHVQYTHPAERARTSHVAE